ncbi:MAG: ATP-binding cassette domain-containing protein, partial [Chitinivibrionales bacterium]|nr:ATP-binding cassette domain-containing protein [Chitinivibrionales bacterium]MBD3358437.1 ATP-binding cassette domain-containing protein [Chitinivibrionales bacterium]
MITLSNVEKQYGAKILYRGVTASINPKCRTGLVGPNGAGKTVLLRILAGEENVDAGTVSIPPDLRLGYLPQEMVFERDISPKELVLEPFRRLLESDRLFARLAEEKPGSEEYRKAAREVERLQSEMMVHNGYQLEARAEAILAGLGVPQGAWEADVRRLSGGYRMRTILARLLLVSPDFL